MVLMSHFVGTLDHFEDTLGSLLIYFWDYLGDTLGSYWGYPRVTLGYPGGDFGSTLELL